MKLALPLVALAAAFVSGTFVHAADDYRLGPDSLVQPGVPQGRWDKFVWESKIFAGTGRDVWVYIPAQYDAAQPTRFMVFQDGVRQYALREGREPGRNTEYAVPNVLDNLIHKGELPVIIGIFIDPGSHDMKGRNGTPNFSNRSVEYDTPNGDYARFLEEEIIPEVERRGYNLRQDAGGRAIGGISSGGICAFNVAWHRPDLFNKVLTDIGSFVNIRGGHVIPEWVRNSEPKPIRVHMQDGANDNDRGAADRSWPAQNLLLAAALQVKRYDYKLVWGDGAHNSRHGASILPESLKWLWRTDNPEPRPLPAPRN